MGVVGGIVTYAVLWFLCLILVVPRGQPTQLEAGKIVPGTPASAPASIRMGRKAIYATLLALVFWTIAFVIVEYQLVTLADLDFLAPESLKSRS